jgi:hypothetical protein
MKVLSVFYTELKAFSGTCAIELIRSIQSY